MGETPRVPRTAPVRESRRGPAPFLTVVRAFRTAPVAGLAAALALASCAGVRDRIHARPGPASTTFDQAEMVDVLAPDVIRAVDDPAFSTAAVAAEWLGEDQPVVVLTSGGESRAYPLLILTWHEIVNDTVAQTPVAVTYDPLSNAAVAFDRRVAGRTETFGVSGKLYRSGLVMFDRRTHSLWPQLPGRAVRGPLEGTRLEALPTQIASFGAFRAAYPDGRILSRETGLVRAYGFNPYEGYDSRSAPFSFFAPRPDPRQPVMERVVGVFAGGEDRAFPYATLRADGGVVADRLGGRDIVVLWRAGTRSPVDAPLMRDGREVGSTGVFVPVLDGRRLTLEATPEGFRDRETGSTWSMLGVAVAGPLAGRALTPVLHLDVFWFAWAAFAPATTIFRG